MSTISLSVKSMPRGAVTTPAAALSRKYSRGVNLNARNESGRTVLSIANYCETPSAVRTLLISAGGEE